MRLYLTFKNESSKEKTMEKLQKKGFRTSIGCSGLVISDVKNIVYTEGALAVEDIKSNWYSIDLDNIKIFDIENK